MAHDLSSSDSESVSSNGDLPQPPPPNSRPYQFEPLAADFEHLNLEGNEPELDPTDFNDIGEIPRDVQRISNTEWCQCNRCINMLEVVECICCKEMNVVDQAADGFHCITDKDEFTQVCLLEAVLDTAYFGYRREGYPIEGHGPEKYRYTAYRQFTRWIFGYPGKKNRKPLPSCVVRAIREKFFSADNVGFKENAEN